MLVVNFAHTLPPEQCAQIESLAGQLISRLIEVRTQFDAAQPFATQAQVLIAKLDLTPGEWAGPLLVNLPSHNVIAALVLTELHARLGHFPAILRMRPLQDSDLPLYEAAEIINLQQVRDAGRKHRGN